MKTTIIESVRRGGYSRLANQFRDQKFLWCKKVTFADYAPSKHPHLEGWLVSDDCTPLTELRAKEIWYRLSTVGGRHKIYYKPIKRPRYAYCLISTINSQTNGWTIFAKSFSKEKLQAKAEELWGGVDEYGNSNIYDDTYYKNRRIVSRTKAERVFHAVDDYYFD